MRPYAFYATYLTYIKRRCHPNVSQIPLWCKGPTCPTSLTSRPDGKELRQTLWETPHCYECIHLLWRWLPFPVLRRIHGYVGETEVKCLHAWGKSFCVNSKRLKKNLLRFKKLSSTVWRPDISLFPESLQKTWGRGWCRRYLRYFTTVLRYTKRRSAWLGFCFVGGTGGTTTHCQLVEPRTQQWTSTGKLWRKWLH